MRKKFKVVINGKEYVVEVEELGENVNQTQTVQAPVPVQVSQPAVQPLSAPQVSQSVSASQSVEGAVSAPMPGKILDIKVSVGEQVKKGRVLMILEAMKMENEIVAPKDGTVKEIKVSVGDTVNRGDPLIVIG